MKDAQRTVAALGFAVMLCALSAGADDSKWGNVEIYEENDTLVPSGISSDALFTQGIRLVFMRSAAHQWPFVAWVHERAPFLGQDEWVSTGGLVIGQNLFTPVVITTFEPDPSDRPFAGFLYGGGRVDLVRVDGNRRQSFELNAGVLGPGALGKDAQAGLHVLRQHRIPKGWERQIGTELALNTRYTYHWRLGNRSIDLTPGLGAALGTIQTYPMAEATLRVGRGLTGMPLGNAPWTVRGEKEGLDRKREDWEYGLFAGSQGRYFLRNAYLDGPLFGGGPEVEKKPFVYDLRGGFFVRHKLWRLTYTVVRRSREFEGESGDKHYFGSVALSREIPHIAGPPPPDCGCFLQRNWLVELGMGRGKGWFEPERPRRGGHGPAARFGIAKGLTAKKLKEQTRLRDRWRIGFEMSGIVREGGLPNAEGVHRDDFLVTSAATLRLRPFSPLRRVGALDLRVGAGRATAKTELTGRDGKAFVEDSGSGFGAIAGADYIHRLGGTLSLGIDATWSYLKIDKRVLARGSFLSSAIVIYWHP